MARLYFKRYFIFINTVKYNFHTLTEKYARQGFITFCECCAVFSNVLFWFHIVYVRSIMLEHLSTLEHCTERLQGVWGRETQRKTCDM